jgi:hypothetical protein
MELVMPFRLPYKESVNAVENCGIQDSEPAIAAGFVQ